MLVPARYECGKKLTHFSALILVESVDQAPPGLPNSIFHIRSSSFPRLLQLVNFRAVGGWCGALRAYESKVSRDFHPPISGCMRIITPSRASQLKASRRETGPQPTVQVAKVALLPSKVESIMGCGVGCEMRTIDVFFQKQVVSHVGPLLVLLCVSTPGVNSYAILLDSIILV